MVIRKKFYNGKKNTPHNPVVSAAIATATT